MNRKTLIIIAAAGSLALMLGAFGFQYIGDMAPCKLCIWQRWPHVAAIVLGAIGMAWPTQPVAMLGALAATTTAGIAVYHSGVEQKWWQGPSSCTTGNVTGLSTDDLMNQIMNAPLVRCDEIPWELFGLSMASWNAVVSFGLASIWILAIRAPAKL